MSIVNLDSQITQVEGAPFSTKDCKLEHRVTKYDLNFGVPLGYRDYDRQVLSYNPTHFWRLAELSYANHGLNSTAIQALGASGLYVPSLMGYRDDNIRKLAGDQVFYAPTIYTIGEKFTVTFAAINYMSVAAFGVPRVLLKLSKTGWSLVLSVKADGAMRLEITGLPVQESEAGFFNMTQVNHIGIVKEGSEIRINCSGKLKAFNFPANPTGALNLILGATATPVSGLITNSPGYGSWVGYIERFAIYDSAISTSSINLLGTIAATGILYNPEMFIDSASFTLSGARYTFDEYMAQLAPVHWWRMSSGSLIEPDLGTGAVNGAYNSTPVTYPGPVVDGFAKGLYGDANKHMQTTARVFPAIQAGGQSAGFTLAFWTAQGADWSRHDDDLLGFTDYINGCGIYASIKGDAITFNKRTTQGNWQVTIPRPYFSQKASLSEVGRNDWTLCVLTVDSAGIMKCYANGLEFISASVATLTAGINVGLTSASRFKVGHVNVSDTSPEQAFSEVSLFDRALTPQEISNLYTVARYGNTLVTFGSSLEEDYKPELPGAFSPTTEANPYLTNPVELTQVVGFSTQHSIDQLVEQAVLQLAPDTLTDTIPIDQVVKVNDYIVIEVKAKSFDGDRDSDWVTMGHYLADSSPYLEESEGRSQWTVPLRTVTKLLSYPLLLDKDVRPDMVKRTNHVLTLVEATPEELRFAALDVNGNPIKNWSAYPNPILEARKFRNLDTPGYNNGQQLNAQEVPSKLVIKGARNSIDINTRTGIIRIDKDFYEGDLGTGIGNPDPEGGLTATFYQFIGAEETAKTTITGITQKDGVWALELGDGIVAKEGITLYPESGNSLNKMFRLMDAGKLPFTGVRNFSSISQSGGDLVFEANPSITNVYGQPFIGGPINEALIADGRSAFTRESTGPNQLTAMVTANGLTTFQSDADKTIVGIEIGITRWCYSRDPYQGGQIFQFLLGWGANSYFKDHVIQLLLNGVPVGDNLARPNDQASFYQSAFTAPGDWKERAIYGGPTNTCGIGSLPGEVIANIGIQIQAKSVRDRCFAGIDAIEITFHFSDGTVGSRTFKVLDYHGGFCNPVFEGMAVGDRVTVGNSNSPDKVIREYMLRVGFQMLDPTKPLYFHTEALPEDLELAVPPLRYSSEQQARGDAPILESLNYVPPNYLLTSEPDGSVLLDRVVQNNDEAIDLGAALSFAINNNENGVFTQYIASSNSGESVDVLLTGTPAIRTYKLDNVATISAGKGSAFGTTYALSAQSFVTLNTRLQELFDGDSTTPKLNGGGWEYPESFGVLHAQNGSHVWPWTMENSPIFCIDLGTESVANQQYLIEAISFTALNSYIDGNVFKQQFAIKYMDESMYAYAEGSFPPPVASQANANTLETYLPDKDHPGWKTLVDNYEAEGEVYIEANDFETQRATRIRFLQVICVQPQYRQGGTTTDKQTRIVLSDMRVYTSRKIVATATVGVSGGYTDPVFRAILARYGLRPYYGVPNGYLDQYGKAKQFSLNQLEELLRDIVPASSTVPFLGIRAKSTVKVWSSAYNRYYYGIVQSVKAERSGISTITLTDYKAEWVNA